MSIKSERLCAMSLEEICREVLSAAVSDGLVKPSVGPVEELTSGQLVGMANRLDELLRPEHVIDCDADPFVPYGWSVEEHQKGGAFKWDKDAQKDALYLSNWQRNGGWIKGDKLRKELADRPVLNANVLDYLLAHPHLIPEEWKDQAVFFWGTIYRDSHGFLYVRYLIWLGRAWDSHHYWLDVDWNDYDPALLAS